MNTQYIALAWRLSDVVYQTQMRFLNDQKDLNNIAAEHYRKKVQEIVDFNLHANVKILGAVSQEIDMTIKEVLREANRVLGELPFKETRRLDHYTNAVKKLIDNPE